MLRALQHQTLTILALLQIVLIVAGTLFTIAATKSWDERFHSQMPFILRSLREFGLLLLLIPVVWLVFAIRRTQTSNWRPEPFIWKAAGTILVVFLAWFYLLASISPFVVDPGPVQVLSE